MRNRKRRTKPIELVRATTRDLDYRGPSRTPSFAGTIGATAPMMPGVSPGFTHRGKMTPGPTVFYDGLTNQPWPFDPFNLHGDHRTDGSSMMILGKRRDGKTTTGMHIATRLAGRRTPFGDMRFMGDVQRRNAGVPELAAYVSQYDCPIVPLADYELNIFADDMLDLPSSLDMCRDSLQLIRGKDLNDSQYDALAIAMDKMYRPEWHDKASPSLLSMLLDRMTTDDVNGERTALEDRFLDLHPDHEGLRMLKQQTPAAPDETVEAAREVAKMIRRLMRKSCIGDRNSLATAMRRQFFAPDYSGLSDEDLVLLQAYIWRVKTLAIRNHRTDLYFNVEIHDENYKLCKYLVYVRAMSEFLKALRGVETFVMLMSHRIADYYAVGPTNSPQYRLATNMIDDIDTFLIGHQPNSARDDLMRVAGITKSEFKHIKRLPEHHWMLKFRNEESRIVYTLPSDAVLKVSHSEAANDSMIIPA